MKKLIELRKKNENETYEKHKDSLKCFDFIVDKNDWPNDEMSTKLLAYINKYKMLNAYVDTTLFNKKHYVMITYYVFEDNFIIDGFSMPDECEIHSKINQHLPL